MSHNPIATNGAPRAKPELTSSERHFVQVQGLYFASDAVAGVFLGLFLFRSNGFSPIAEYWITTLAVSTVGMTLSGYVLARRSTRWLIRLGLLLLCGEYTLVLILGAGTSRHVIAIGCINGIALSAYWSGVNLTEMALTHVGTRSLYMGLRTLWTQVCPTLGQLVAGVAIALAALAVGKDDAYLAIFLLIVLTYALTFVHARDIEPLTGVRFRLRDSLGKPRSPAWRPCLILEMFRGFTDTALAALVPPLIYVVVKREITVSVITGCVTLLSGAGGMLAGRMLQRTKSAYLIGAWSVPIGLLGFGLMPGWTGLACYAVTVGLAMAFSDIPVATASYDAIDHSGLSWQHVYHYFVEREIMLNVGRILSFLLVLKMVPAAHQAPAVRHVVMILAAAPFMIGLIQGSVNRRLSRAL